VLNKPSLTIYSTQSINQSPEINFLETQLDQREIITVNVLDVFVTNLVLHAEQAITYLVFAVFRVGGICGRMNE
jgi:hypothetical protein